MDLDYFWCMTANSKKYACSKLPGYNKFGGMKWKNISLKEMFQFYGIILRMSIGPQHMGGYEAYFQPTTKLRCGP
eukprot:6798372-Ditylum_brightwellii.AAC.1